MNKYDRVYELNIGSKNYWSRKGIKVCFTCRKSLEAGMWVLVTRAANPKVRHIQCALKVRICDPSDLPETAIRALRGQKVISGIVKQQVRT